jgi:Lar family restriction alleviation protein
MRLLSINYQLKGGAMTKALKPCPFCGADARYDSFGPRRVLVYCVNLTCGARIPAYPTRQLATTVWNRRKEDTLASESGNNRVG